MMVSKIKGVRTGVHISFVILHYLTINDTVECINSIKKNVKYKNYSIVIVDNGSKNFTGEKLQDMYKSDDNVVVIINEENLGFAKGNNVGFNYAKIKFKADFIIMINNDTAIYQNNFIEKLLENYEEEKFDVCGPNIMSSIDNKKQNPVKREFYNIDDVVNRIRKQETLLFLSNFRLDVIFQKLYAIISVKKVQYKENIITNPLKKYQLHGACIIFSPSYIQRYDGIYDKTFMYGEEDILNYIVERDSLILMYFDNITIYHKEYSSTNMLLGKGVKKRQFYYRNRIKSSKLLKNLMEEELN
jgi:GT2 family glycosyltransferase